MSTHCWPLLFETSLNLADLGNISVVGSTYSLKDSLLKGWEAAEAQACSGIPNGALSVGAQFFSFSLHNNPWDSDCVRCKLLSLLYKEHEVEQWRKESQDSKVLNYLKSHLNQSITPNTEYLCKCQFCALRAVFLVFFHTADTLTITQVLQCRCLHFIQRFLHIPSSWILTTTPQGRWEKAQALSSVQPRRNWKIWCDRLRSPILFSILLQHHETWSKCPNPSRVRFPSLHSGTQTVSMFQHSVVLKAPVPPSSMVILTYQWKTKKKSWRAWSTSNLVYIYFIYSLWNSALKSGQYNSELWYSETGALLNHKEDPLCGNLG